MLFQKNSSFWAFPIRKAGPSANGSSLSLDVKIVFQTLNSVTAALLAYNGLAYALVPESCTITGENRLLHYHLPPELDAEWIIGIATLDKYPLSHAASQLRSLMLEKFKV